MNNKMKLWLVETNHFIAIVRATHETNALVASGYDEHRFGRDGVAVYEIDINSISDMPDGDDLLLKRNKEDE
jgi:hypothetical protein